MNGDECIRAIVFAGEKLAQFEFLQLVGQTRVLADQFLLGRGARRGVGFFGGQFLQGFEIRGITLQFRERINEGTQTRDLLDIGLRAFTVRPEVGRGHARFEFR